MTPKQGRPQKSVSNITIEGLQVQYIVTKRNNWGQDISYFKLLDGFKPKVKPLYKGSREEGGKLKIPIWGSDAKEVNDTKDYMFKVTKKFATSNFSMASSRGSNPCTRSTKKKGANSKFLSGRVTRRK